MLWQARHSWPQLWWEKVKKSGRGHGDRKGKLKADMLLGEVCIGGGSSLGLTKKCPANGFIGFLFSDGFFYL